MEDRFSNILRSHSEHQSSEIPKTVQEPSTDICLKGAIELVKSAQKQHSRDIESRDKDILRLEWELKSLQSQLIEVEKQNKGLLLKNQFLEEMLVTEQNRNRENQVEIQRLKQEAARSEAFREKASLRESELKSDNEKANHIIKTLLLKLRSRPKKPLSTSDIQ